MKVDERKLMWPHIREVWGLAYGKDNFDYSELMAPYLVPQTRWQRIVGTLRYRWGEMRWRLRQAWKMLRYGETDE